VPAVIVGGAATLIITGMWMRLFPQLSAMDRMPSAASESRS
jgi:hypothetical protein